MAYEAKVFRVLIASPSDVIEEREIAVKTIQEWNDLNSSERQIVLLPLRWETHTAPEYGKRPQEVINRQIVDHCDLLIGIFWTRIGSPTGVQDSGTLEEIDRVAASGKPVMLYFSKALKNPDDIDTDQLIKLRDFKKKTYPKALVENYSGQVEFRDKLAKQIEMQLRNLLSDDGSNISGKIESDISIEFSPIDSDEGLGQKVKLKTEYLDISGSDVIPDYLNDKKEEEIFIENEDGTITSMVMGGGSRANKDYYRDYVDYVSLEKMFTPIDFWLKNLGNLGAKDLFIDLQIYSENDTFKILSSDNFGLTLPSKNRKRGVSISRRSYDSRISLKKVEGKENTWNGTFELNALQPKREICPNASVYIGAKSSCKALFEATIYADSLPEPIRHKLEVELDVDVRQISALELLEQGDVLPTEKSA